MSRTAAAAEIERDRRTYARALPRSWPRLCSIPRRNVSSWSRTYQGRNRGFSRWSKRSRSAKKSVVVFSLVTSGADQWKRLSLSRHKPQREGRKPTPPHDSLPLGPARKGEGERAAEDYPQNGVPASDRDGYTQSYWDALFKELGDIA